MEIADKKEDEIVFCDTESMEQQKARSRQRNGLGIEPVQAVGLDREDAMNLLVEVAECSAGMLRTGFGLVNIDDMCLRPFRARNFSRWLSVGLSVFSPEISEITAFRW